MAKSFFSVMVVCCPLLLTFMSTASAGECYTSRNLKELCERLEKKDWYNDYDISEVCRKRSETKTRCAAASRYLNELCERLEKKEWYDDDDDIKEVCRKRSGTKSSKASSPSAYTASQTETPTGLPSASPTKNQTGAPSKSPSGSSKSPSGSSKSQSGSSKSSSGSSKSPSGPPESPSGSLSCENDEGWEYSYWGIGCDRMIEVYVTCRTCLFAYDENSIEYVCKLKGSNDVTMFIACPALCNVECGGGTIRY